MQDTPMKPSQGQVTWKGSKGKDVFVNFTGCFLYF